MTASSHNARYRARHQAPSKPRRLIAGLALPTSAALALIFCAAGAAVATSPKSQNVAFGQYGTGTGTPQPAPVESAAMRARHLKEIDRGQAVARTRTLRATEQNLAVVRATAVARDVERKNLAARAVVIKRAALAHGWRLPLARPVVSSTFGFRWGRLHAGQDYAAPTGTPLGAMSTGTVVFAGVQGGYGNLVKIRYWDGTVSFYGHMSRISVKSGESVEPGDVVGRSGNSGHSTGPHLHLEIHPAGDKPVNPAPWLASHLTHG